jgi:hypothetical protein
MGEADRVFARFRDETPSATDRRELRSIPRRGTRGNRTVEVVHVRSGAASRGPSPQRPSSVRVRAATWEDGFPARQAPQPAPAPQPAAGAPDEPTIHVMPAWEPAPAVPGEAATAPAPRPRAPRRPERRRVADPFDAAEDGANCLRCGYAVEPARERRGLMTCARCT